MRPWMGHAAASPKAQIVRPSTCLLGGHNAQQRESKFQTVNYERTLTPEAYRFPVDVPVLLQTGPSYSSSMLCPLGKVCTVRTTHACRTVGQSRELEHHYCYRINLTCEKRAIALTISVLLFMTITAPVPRPDCASFSES